MTARDIQQFGLFMLVATIIVLWVNVLFLSEGQGSPTITAALGLLVGVGGYVVGEIRR